MASAMASSQWDLCSGNTRHSIHRRSQLSSQNLYKFFWWLWQIWPVPRTSSEQGFWQRGQQKIPKAETFSTYWARHTRQKRCPQSVLIASVRLSWQMGQMPSSWLVLCREIMASTPHCQPAVCKASLPPGALEALPYRQFTEDGPTGKSQSWSSLEDVTWASSFRQLLTPRQWSLARSTGPQCCTSYRNISSALTCTLWFPCSYKTCKHSLFFIPYPWRKQVIQNQFCFLLRFLQITFTVQS